MSIIDSIISSGAQGIGSLIQQSGGNLLNPGTIAQFSSNPYDPNNTLQGMSARSDPMLSFCWFAQMPVITPNQAQQSNAGLGGILSGVAQSAANSVLNGILGATASSAITGAAQLPWAYVEEAALPFRAFETRSIFREGRSRHYPDKYSVDNLKLGIYADSANVAINYLTTWQSTILKPFTVQQSSVGAGGYGRPSEYKKPIQFYLLDVTYQEIVSVEYTECWPTSIDTYQMDSGTSTRIRHEVSFSVGDVFVTALPVGGLQTIAGVLANPSSLPSTVGGLLSKF